MSLNDMPPVEIAQAITGSVTDSAAMSDVSEALSASLERETSPSLLPMYLGHICLWPGCKAAQRDFLTSYDLDFHIQTYHMRQCPWPTCVIQRSFRRKSDLLRHMESVHSGVRRFICDFPCCYTTYSRKDKLTAHKRSHFQPRQKTLSLDMNTKPNGLYSGTGNGNMLPMAQGPTPTSQWINNNVEIGDPD
jgi:hypothetical protein